MKLTELDKDAAALLERAYSLKNPEESKALYEEWAETYDATMLDGLGYLTPQRTAKLLVKHLPDASAKILDVGSGTGLAGQELYGLGYHNLEALDYSPQMLAIAESRGCYQRTIEADLTAVLPLQTASFQGMICTGTFTHAHVGCDALDELFRVLAPSGIMACTVHNVLWENEFREKVEYLNANATLIVREQYQATYYKNSQEPEGWFLAWERGK